MLASQVSIRNRAFFGSKDLNFGGLKKKEQIMGKVKKFYVCDETDWWIGIYSFFSQEVSHSSADEAQEYMIDAIKYKMAEISITELEETINDYGFYQAIQLWTSKNPLSELPLHNQRDFLEALVLIIVSTEYCHVREMSEDEDSDDVEE
jgi:hypothetical protein